MRLDSSSQRLWHKGRPPGGLGVGWDQSTKTAGSEKGGIPGLVKIQKAIENTLIN